MVPVAEASPLGSFSRQLCRSAHRPRVSGLGALGWPISTGVDFYLAFMASAPRTVRELSDHPAVHVVNETATQNGYWVYLKPDMYGMGPPPTFMNRLLRRAAKRWQTFAGIPSPAACASRREVEELLGEPHGAIAERFRDSEITDLREVKNAQGIHVPTALSRQGVVEFSDSFSLCGAAACLDAAGFTLSPKVAALSRRWADLGQKPNPEGVAMAREILGA